MLKVSFDKNIIGPWLCERLRLHWNARGMLACGTYDPKLGPMGIRGGVLWENFSGPGGSVMIHCASDLSRRWLTRNLLWFICDYTFNQMRVDKVYSLVRAKATDILEFDRKFGMVEETRIKDVFPNDDGVVVSMYKRDCKWLDEKYMPKAVREMQQEKAA